MHCGGCFSRCSASVLPDLQLTAFRYREALEHVANHRVDLVISDYRMPVMDGVTFLTRVKELQPDTARIILSAFADMEAIVRAINEAGIFRFVSKPWSDAELKAIVAQVLAHRELLVENSRLADEVRCQRGVISRQQVELARSNPKVRASRGYAGPKTRRTARGLTCAFSCTAPDAAAPSPCGSPCLQGRDAHDSSRIRRRQAG